MFAMTFAMSGVAMSAPIQMGTVLQTGSGDDIAPIIKAKWEMKRAIQFNTDGTVANMSDFTTDLDDAEWTPLAQISPTGVYQDDVPYTICAIVTDGHTNSDHNQYLAGVCVQNWRPHLNNPFCGGERYWGGLHLVIYSRE